MRWQLIVFAMLLLLVSYSPQQFAPAAEKTPPCFDDEAERNKVRDILRRALDVALQRYVEHQFEGWMKDDHDQPRRAMRGTNEAIDAYVRAHRAVNGWDLRICP